MRNPATTKAKVDRFQLAIDMALKLTLHNLEMTHQGLMEETVKAEVTSHICDALNLAEIGQELVQRIVAITHDDYDSFAGEFVKVYALARAMRLVYGEHDSYASRVLTGLVENIGVMFELVEFVELEEGKA